MRTHLLRGLAIAIAVFAGPVGMALAHGEPIIAVEPAVVAAGGQITITGTEMEPGEVFAITLEGLTTSISLGEVTVTGEGEAGGFVATFTIPADSAPGSYTVRATTEEGESAVADLTVTAPSVQASAGPVMVEQPSGELHQVDRTKPPGQIAAVVVVALVSGGLGFWLMRRRPG